MQSLPVGRHRACLLNNIDVHKNYANTRIILRTTAVTEVFLQCQRSSSYAFEPQTSSFFFSISGMIKSGQVARYNTSFPFSFQNENQIKAKYLHTFIINLLCLKYFYSMFMFSMRIVAYSLSYCMINTIK